MIEILGMVFHNLYKPNFVQKRVNPVLYVELQKALYGTLNSCVSNWVCIVAPRIVSTQFRSPTLVSQSKIILCTYQS